MNIAVEEQFQAILTTASGGDEGAYRCLMLAASYFHYFDDLVDKDIELAARTLVTCKNMLLRLAVDPFFQAHRDVLVVSLLLIGEDYTASNEDSRWQILRHSGNNFVRTVALLVGGEQLLNVVSKELRDLSLRDHYTADGKPI